MEWWVPVPLLIHCFHLYTEEHSQTLEMCACMPSFLLSIYNSMIHSLLNYRVQIPLISVPVLIHLSSNDLYRYVHIHRQRKPILKKKNKKKNSLQKMHIMGTEPQTLVLQDRLEKKSNKFLHRLYTAVVLNLLKSEGHLRDLVTDCGPQWTQKSAVYVMLIRGPFSSSSFCWHRIPSC